MGDAENPWGLGCAAADVLECPSRQEPIAVDGDTDLGILTSNGHEMLQCNIVNNRVVGYAVLYRPLDGWYELPRVDDKRQLDVMRLGLPILDRSPDIDMAPEVPVLSVGRLCRGPNTNGSVSTERVQHILDCLFDVERSAPSDGANNIWMREIRHVEANFVRTVYEPAPDFR